MESQWQVRATRPGCEWLNDHASGWQFGESGFLKAICDRIGVDQAVEIGAGDGDSLPLTLAFLYDQGVPALLFEKDYASREKLKHRYRKADIYGEWLLGKPDLHLISNRSCVVVDVDSFDYEIADSIAWPKSASVICVEHYDKCGPGASDNYGVPPKWLLGKQLAEGGFIIQAKAGDIEEMMEVNGFSLIGISRVNSIFVRSDLVATLEG